MPLGVSALIHIFVRGLAWCFFKLARSRQIFFIDLAIALTGKAREVQEKAAVVASGLMGTVCSSCCKCSDDGAFYFTFDERAWVIKMSLSRRSL